jgi:hypothetical protein
MAWKFLDESTHANKKYREEMMELINSWWAHFQNKRKAIEGFLNGRGHVDIEDFMADCLQNIDENLMWEFGTESGGERYQLVITPETERHLRPLVETIIASAPKLTNWSFYGYRQPHGFEDTAELVKDHTGVDTSAISFKATLTEDHLIELLFDYKGQKGAESLGDAVFMATEYLLGEEVLDRWIGEMEVNDTGASGPFISMSELPNTVADLIKNIQKSLPDKPLAAIRGTLKPQEITVEDEPEDDEERDVIWARTLHPKVWQAAHGESAFDSCRFSRHNERFCYLKIEGFTAEEKLNELENRINDALSNQSLGCTLGLARGARFGYIDLCLVDPAKAIPVLKGMESKCHLEFFDADWASESIPL